MTRELSWTKEDLDRCEHGRHSIDPCFSCPGGWSTGNQYLTRGPEFVTVEDSGQVAVRIGTMLGGHPILVTPIRARESVR